MDHTRESAASLEQQDRHQNVIKLLKKKKIHYYWYPVINAQAFNAVASKWYIEDAKVIIVHWSLPFRWSNKLRGVALTTYNAAPQVVAKSPSPNQYVTTVTAEKIDNFVNNYT